MLAQDHGKGERLFATMRGLIECAIASSDVLWSNRGAPILAGWLVMRLGVCGDAPGDYVVAVPKRRIPRPRMR